MTVIRCTAKLLKRLRQPAKPPEPLPPDNPLGEWYADIDFWRRQPFVVMLNSTTGVGLVLPGNAADLRQLPQMAALQLTHLFQLNGLGSPECARELNAWSSVQFAATRDRSLLSSLNQRKFEVWVGFEHSSEPAFKAAMRLWDGFFKHPCLPKNQRSHNDWHRPLDLVRARLMPSADVIDLATRRPGA
jgi:hypothetical protein